MIVDFDFDNGGEMEKNNKIKTSRYQVLPAVMLRLHYERSKMKNPVYYRLVKNGSFVGFKRIVTEYLPAAATRWQLETFPHDEEDTQILSQPAMGISTMGREKITTGKQRRVTKPKSLISTGDLVTTE